MEKTELLSLYQTVNVLSKMCVVIVRLFERGLTMDGVRLKSAGKFVDKNRERENSCKLYEGPACFKDFLGNL